MLDLPVDVSVVLDLRCGGRTLPAVMQNPDHASGGHSYVALLARLWQQQEQRNRHIVGTWQPVQKIQA